MSSSTPVYSSSQLSTMNYSYPWNGKLTSPNDQKSSSDLYELHATGNADLNGREYIALPKGITITPEIKRRYNLI